MGSFRNGLEVSPIHFFMLFLGLVIIFKKSMFRFGSLLKIKDYILIV